MSKEASSPELPVLEELSIAELDQTLEDAVLENERSEKLICYALLEMDKKQGYKTFGFISIYDYASQRFDFSDRKTRYLLELARKITKYPMIEKALADGKVGWSKAYRMVKLAAAEDEVLSLESAMSLSVRELDRRLRKKMDGVVTKLHLWMTEDQQSVFEYALEVCRRVSGANLSMEQCVEYLAGEFLATWAYEASAVKEACENEGPQPSNPNEGGDDEPVDDEILLAEAKRICPETGDLPLDSRTMTARVGTKEGELSSKRVLNWSLCRLIDGRPRCLARGTPSRGDVSSINAPRKG